MNKLNVSLEAIKKSAAKHSPEILTGIGIAGMITAAVLAVRATPKAISLIEDKKALEKAEELTAVETVKTVWKCYIPTALTIIAGSACLICANSVNHRRNVALAAAYSLSESSLIDYQKKVIETVGENKDKLIRSEIANDKLRKNPIKGSEVIVTGKGNTLCYDSVSGRYFRSDIETLKRAANDLNRQMRDELYISLNEFYSEIGLSTIAVGENIGWNIDKGYIELQFGSKLAEDDTPCIVVEYKVVPKYLF